VVAVLLIFGLLGFAVYKRHGKRKENDDKLKAKLAESEFRSQSTVAVLETPEKEDAATPNFNIPLSDGIPNQIFCFSKGQGIQLLANMLEFLFVPLNVELTAAQSYSPRYEDEIAVRKGDLLAINHYRTDSWCVGTNFTTGCHGLFPLQCAEPRYPIRVAIHDFSDHQILDQPREIINSIARAFPENVSCRQVNTVPASEYFGEIFQFSAPTNYHECFICGDEQFINQIKYELIQLEKRGCHVPKTRSWTT
jgi:hypothetical protein